jgi:hypothetical protein
MQWFLKWFMQWLLQWFLYSPASSSISSCLLVLQSITLEMDPACNSLLDDHMLGSRAAVQGAVINGVSCTWRYMQYSPLHILGNRQQLWHEACASTLTWRPSCLSCVRVFRQGKTCIAFCLSSCCNSVCDVVAELQIMWSESAVTCPGICPEGLRKSTEDSGVIHSVHCDWISHL